MGQSGLVVLFIAVVIAATTAQQGEKTGVCPKAEGTIGICSFNPEINCVGDNACPNSQKCCSDGCNKICKDPVNQPPSHKPRTSKRGTCPNSDGVVGICSFDPSKNCLDDSDCLGEQKCCSDGCGKVCKSIISVRQKLGRCPKPSSQVGICSITENSCEEDTGCPRNLKCCPDGCVKVCSPPVLGRRG